MPPPTLSIIVPVYNEERYVQAALERLAGRPYPGTEQEVIVVDDGSSDRTPQLLAGWANRPGFRVLTHPQNRGKGAAIRTGLAHVTGRVVAVQDADLEYDPDDLPGMVAPILSGDVHAVYGSRYLDPDNYLPWTKSRLAVHLMNGIARILYGVRLTDVNTCYKVLRADLYRRLDLRAERFEFCAEVTAKLARGRVAIREVPIRYHPRSKADGKKIGWRDARQFALALLAWRTRAVPSLTEFASSGRVAITGGSDGPGGSLQAAEPAVVPVPVDTKYASDKPPEGA